jgi:hypothetical protein
MIYLQKFLTNIIGLGTGYIAASIWLANDERYLNALPIVFLCIALKYFLNEMNE